MSNMIPIPSSFGRSNCNEEKYKKMYAASLSDPEAFWGEQGKRLDWFKPYGKVKNCTFEPPVRIRWYEDGKLNASYNCLDRHLKKRGDQTALIWEPDEPTEAARKFTYRELHEQVCRMANALKAGGVKKGDFVTIYLPMIPEATVAILACARIGAPHSVVFGGFSAESLADRISGADSRFVITADEGRRAGKKVPLKANVDAALKKATGVEKVWVVKHTGAPVTMGSCDSWMQEEMKKASSECKPEEMDAEDPLFILFTSGSTGKPKGVLHTTGGYMVFVSMTHEYVFDYREGEVYWCTADVGWVTGHSYIVKEAAYQLRPNPPLQASRRAVQLRSLKSQLAAQIRFVEFDAGRAAEHHSARRHRIGQNIPQIPHSHLH
jgi:acetyl-CoA synthetase